MLFNNSVQVKSLLDLLMMLKKELLTFCILNSSF